MTKWCLNYDSGEYEYIDTDATASTGASMSTIGMTANIAVRKKRKNDVFLMTKTMTKKLPLRNLGSSAANFIASYRLQARGLHRPVRRCR